MSHIYLIGVGKVSLHQIEKILNEINVTFELKTLGSGESLDKVLQSLSDQSESNESVKCFLIHATSQHVRDIKLKNKDNVFLLTAPPHLYIAQQADWESTIGTIDEFVHQWREDIDVVLSTLRSYSGNLNVCCLADIENNPHAFADALFKTKMKETESKEADELLDSLKLLAVESQLIDSDVLYELYDELLSESYLFGDFEVHLSPDSETFKVKSTILKSAVCQLKLLEQNGAAIQLELEETQSRLLKVTQESINRLKELENTQFNLSNTEDDLTLSKKEIESLTKTNNSLLAENSDKDEKLVDLVSQLEAQTAEFEESSAQFEKTCVKLSEANVELSLRELKQSDELFTLQNTIEKLQLENDLLTDEVNLNIGLKAELLQSKLSDSNSLQQLEKSQEEIEELSSELVKEAHFQNLLIEVESKLTHLQAEFDSLMRENVQLEEQLFSLQERLEKNKTLTSSDVTEMEFRGVLELENRTLRQDLKTSEILSGEETQKLTNRDKTIEESIGTTEDSLLTELQGCLEDKQKEIQKLVEKINEFTEIVDTLKSTQNSDQDSRDVETRLASMQISQLQEELEYYFEALQTASFNQSPNVNHPSPVQSVFSKASVSDINVTGKFESDDYRDLHLSLTNVLMPCGRVFDTLAVKLIFVSGEIGLEIRDSLDGELFSHRESQTDEYGPFLRYFPEYSHIATNLQAGEANRLTASDRLLLLCSINLLSEFLPASSDHFDVVLSKDELRFWRVAASQLANSISISPQSLFFDSAILKEAYSNETYEHLWFRLENLLVGDVFCKSLELKLAAREVKPSVSELFSSSILLEFRDQSDGSAPLLTWPPETEDEFGSIYFVPLSDLSSLVNLAQRDRDLITQLIQNIAIIIENLDCAATSMNRNKLDWVNACDAAIQLTETSESDELTDPAQLEASNKMLFVDEVISIGGYQHIVFKSSSNSIKLKLKAKNINAETFDAELYIELRDDTDSVIYSETEFFGEDDYGPRVQVPLESLLGTLQADRATEFAWLIEVFERIQMLLASSDDLDPPVRQLWADLIKRKQSFI